MTFAHIAGIPAEEWLMPIVTTAGAALVGMRAMFASSRGSSASQRAQRPPNPSHLTNESQLGRPSTKEN